MKWNTHTKWTEGSEKYIFKKILSDHTVLDWDRYKVAVRKKKTIYKSVFFVVVVIYICVVYRDPGKIKTQIYTVWYQKKKKFFENGS